jgi:hypothetical protein
MASHPGMQNNRIIVFFSENRLHWQFEVEKKFQQMAIVGYIFMYLTNKTLVHNASYVFEEGVKFKP